MLKKHHISLNNWVRQGTGNIVSDMSGERVMLSVQNGKYYNLGIIGGLIWDKIEMSKSVSRLIDELLAEFAVEHAECENQVLSFLEMLLERNLIILDEKAGS